LLSEDFRPDRLSTAAIGEVAGALNAPGRVIRHGANQTVSEFVTAPRHQGAQ
jgi:hypothetical protein